MSKILEFIKKYKFPLGLLLLIILIVLFFNLLKKTEVLGPSKPGQANYQSLTPGKSSKDDVDKKLGDPINEETNQDLTTNAYKSTSPARNHEVIFENETSDVTFIKEIVSSTDDTNAGILKQQYGDPVHKLYNRSSPNSSFSLYVYPEQGLAYLGHNDGTLLEIWYYPPLESLSDFIKQWASNYSLRRPAPIQ